MNDKFHYYKSSDDIIHVCKSKFVHSQINLVWTKCQKDVRDSNSFITETPQEITCSICKYETAIERIRHNLGELKELVSEKRVNKQGIKYYSMIIKELEDTLIELGE